MVLIALIYGINPSAHSLMSWTTPFVLSMLIGGLMMLAAFCHYRAACQIPDVPA